MRERMSESESEGESNRVSEEREKERVRVRKAKQFCFTQQWHCKTVCVKSFSNSPALTVLGYDHYQQY